MHYFLLSLIVVVPFALGQTPVVVSGAPGSTSSATQTFRFVAANSNGAPIVNRIYFLVNTDSTIPPNVCHGFYDRPGNGFYLYNDDYSALLGPLSVGGGGILSNSQCTLFFSGSGLVSSSGTGITIDLRIGLSGSLALTSPKVYLWVVDAAGIGTGWVQTSSWNLASAQPPSLVASTPPITTDPNPVFTFTGRDPNGTADLQRFYFVVNSTAATEVNGCHGFYDRASNAFYLYDDALTALIGPLSPGGSAQTNNAQCEILGTGSSAAIVNATDLAVSIKLKMRGSFVGTNKKVYVWIVDNSGGGTGWVQTSTWNSGPSSPPSLLSFSPESTGDTPATFDFTLRDLNSVSDLQRLYFTVGAIAGTPAGGCHGFFDRAANAFFLYDNTLTVLQGPLSPGGTIQNSQCQILSTGSSITSLSPTDLKVSIRMGLLGTFASTNKNVYVWIVDNSNNGTGWLKTSVWSTALKTLRNCLEFTSNPICTLPSDPTPYRISGPIKITRSNVTLQGSGSRPDTKIVRSPEWTGPLIEIDNAYPVSGVKLQNFTVCGSAKTVWDQNAAPPGAFVDLGASDVGCPRVPTICGDMLSNRTKAQQEEPIGDLQASDIVCTDLSVGNVGLPNSPADNVFSFTGPYALEINNVDFEDATGHAISLFAKQGLKKVNDVFIHDGAINYSGVTGILYGTNGIQYDYAYCDGYKDKTGLEFRNDLSLYAPRNIRIEGNEFKKNNTGAMGGGAMRWVGLRGNNFYKNYIYPQDGNNGGGTVEFDPCADKIQISNNLFEGPLSFYKTEALELYSRNTEISGNNRILNYGNAGIVAVSTTDTKIIGNDIKGNGWHFTTGAITVANSFGSACDANPRDSNNVEITNNLSATSPAPALYNSQTYGVFIPEYNASSPGQIKNLSISAGNTLQHSAVPVFLDWYVELFNYNQVYGWPFALNSNPDVPVNPKALPVDVVAISPTASWPPVPRCRCIDPPAPAKPCDEKYPQGTKNGSQRAMFRFAASDPVSADNLLQIRGVLSINGDDATGLGGPSGSGLCHFMYDPVNNKVYLDHANADWTFPQSLTSPVGNTGGDIGGPGTLNPNCKIRAGSSTSWKDFSQATRQTVAYVNLDIELVASPVAKYHIYNFSQSTTGSSMSNGPPFWSYMGYWRNAEQ